MATKNVPPVPLSMPPNNPLTLHIVTPVILSFAEFTFIDFDHFSFPSNHFRFTFYEVECDLPTELKPITRSVLFYLVLF
jgi:hypothetical protein